MTVRKLALCWSPAALWMGFIFFLSAQSRPLGGSTPAAFTVAGHVAEYAILALLFFWALLQSGLSKGKGRMILGLAVSFAAAVLYGASDEYHQAFVSGRVASWQDWGLDALGAFAAAAVMGLWGPGLLGRQSRYRRTVLPARPRRGAP